MRPQAAAMKALLDQPGLQIMPGCGDGMGARLIEEAGFRTGFVSGSSIAAMRLAMPDMDLLTFPEMADAVETVISAAPNVLWGRWRHRLRQRAPVLKTIRAYARRGAAAVLIEDKVWPRPLGHGGAKLVIERDAALLRCRGGMSRGGHPVARRPKLFSGFGRWCVRPRQPELDRGPLAHFAPDPHSASGLPWRWPGTPPAYIFAENDLGADQQSLLQCVYRNDYTSATRRSIIDSAIIKAYSKALLVAIVLHVLCAKLKAFVELVKDTGLAEADRIRLFFGLLAVRDRLARKVEPDHLEFITILIRQSSRSRSGLGSCFLRG